MIRKRQLPRQEVLHLLFDYDPATGVFVWKMGRCAGRIAGFINAHGYTYIGVDGAYYYAHRLAYVYIHGDVLDNKTDIDHINRNRSDNRITNLRTATRSQNCANSENRKKKDGLPRGVYRDGSRYRAAIRVNRRRIHLGNYCTSEEAKNAYSVATQEFFGLGTQ